MTNVGKASNILGQVISHLKAGGYEGKPDILAVELMLVKRVMEGRGQQESRRADWEERAANREMILIRGGARI